MNVKKLLNLERKVILVTGGASNYGRCIAEGLAEAGATVIILYQKSSPEKNGQQ